MAARFWSPMLEPWEEFHIEVVPIEEDDIAAGDKKRDPAARRSDDRARAGRPEPEHRALTAVSLRSRQALSLLARGQYAGYAVAVQC